MTDPDIANMQGAEALPRRNGELVFEAPWEGRAFGIAVALGNRGLCRWRDFHQRFVAEIAEAEGSDEPSTYYQRWLAALERLVIDKGLATLDELDRKMAEQAARDSNLWKW